jgi:hypothetical protein
LWVIDLAVLQKAPALERLLHFASTRRLDMVAHAGEKAREAGMFHDQHCNGKGRVNKGAEIPKCPKCGGTPTMNELRTSGR